MQACKLGTKTALLNPRRDEASRAGKEPSRANALEEEKFRYSKWGWRTEIDAQP